MALQVVNFVSAVMQPQHPKKAIESYLVTSEFFASEARSFQDKAMQIKSDANSPTRSEEATT